MDVFCLTPWKHSEKLICNYLTENRKAFCLKTFLKDRNGNRIHKKAHLERGRDRGGDREREKKKFQNKIRVSVLVNLNESD